VVRSGPLEDFSQNMSLNSGESRRRAGSHHSGAGSAHSPAHSQRNTTSPALGHHSQALVPNVMSPQGTPVVARAASVGSHSPERRGSPFFGRLNPLGQDNRMDAEQFPLSETRAMEIAQRQFETRLLAAKASQMRAHTTSAPIMSFPNQPPPEGDGGTRIGGFYPIPRPIEELLWRRNADEGATVKRAPESASGPGYQGSSSGRHQQGTRVDSPRTSTRGAGFDVHQQYERRMIDGAPVVPTPSPIPQVESDASTVRSPDFYEKCRRQRADLQGKVTQLRVDIMDENFEMRKIKNPSTLRKSRKDQDRRVEEVECLKKQCAAL
jgi:hypothetical protein